MRGKHVTKPIEEVLREAKELIADGVRELIIVAQDTTYYGLDLYGRVRLAELLRELDGWPLAVTLLAYQARFYADLAELAGTWRRKRAALLTRGIKKREADLGASVEMSLGCPLLTAEARRLLALLGILPDGIRRADLAELLGPDGPEAAAAVRRVGGLAFDDGPRLRVLAPLRARIRSDSPNCRGMSSRNACTFHRPGSAPLAA